MSRSPRGSVDWNLRWNRSKTRKSRRSPRGSVDWNNKNRISNRWYASRSPRGSVDWNPSVWFFLYPTIVAPLVGAWIEIVTDPASCTRSESLPSWERGLKFWQDQGTDRLWSVAPLAGATIEIEKTIVYNVLYDYIEGGHLIEQDGQAKQLGNGNAYGSPILEKRNNTGRIRDGKQIFE